MTSSRDKPRDAADHAKVVPLTQPPTRPLRRPGKRAPKGDDDGCASEPSSEPPVTLVEGGVETLPIMPEGPPHRAGDLLPGTRVSHFEVLRLLGRGGMGDVYLARDTQLGRRIALKLVRQRPDSSAGELARAMAEARLTARCNHPHIVAIHAVGEHQGRPFLALEYLEGETLHERLSRERPAPQATLRTGLAIAEALAAAHENGVLHRDLKPGNVMLPRDGRLRVVDFGLARPIGAASDEGEGEGEGQGERDRETPEARDGEARDGGARDGGAHDGERWVEESQICGTPRYMAPEQWEQRPCSDKTDIFALGVMLFEMLAGDSPFAEPGISLPRLATLVTLESPRPLQAKDAPPLLSEAVLRCLERDPEQRPSAAELVELLGRLVSSSWASEQRDRRPFVGLLPFAEDRAAAYFGRTAEVAACVERLRDEALLPVVGPSGAGKTSFVHAGVIPRLREQASWVVLSLRPGGDPFRSLARQLSRAAQPRSASGGSHPQVSSSATASAAAPSSGDAASVDEDNAPSGSLSGRLAWPLPLGPAPDEGSLELQLAAEPARLGLALERLASARRCRVLLAIDQLEELFTHVEDGEVRRRFAAALVAAADDSASPVRVVFTMRDDFLGRLAHALGNRALRHVTVLGTPERADLLEALQAPLALCGHRFDDPTLPEEMVDAVRGQSSALPLLQFTARLLWERRDVEGRALRRRDYDELGGVVGALARHADQLYEAMDIGEQGVLRELTLRLVTPARTRRVLPLSEALGGLGERAPAVVERWIAARLLVRRRAGRGAELELAHEALIEGWERLSRWIDEGEDELSFLDETRRAAALWDARHRPQGEVWQGPALAEALRRAERCRAPLPPLCRAFLDAGRQREEAHERALRRRRYGAMTVLGLVALGAIVVAWRFRDEQAKTERQRAAAEEQRLRARGHWAEALREGARAAFERRAHLEALAKLRGALELTDSLATRALWLRLRQHPLLWRRRLAAGLYDVAVSARGDALAAAATDGAVYLLEGKALRKTVLRGHADQVFSVVFGPNDDGLLSADWAGHIRRWRQRDGEGWRGEELHAAGGEVFNVAVDAEGARAAYGTVDGLLWVYELKTGKSRALRRPGYNNSRAAITGVAFHPRRATLLAVGTAASTIELWDVARARRVATLRGHQAKVARLAFSPDGRTLASASRDHTIRLWPLDPRGMPASGEAPRVLRGHHAGVYSLAFAASGERLVSGGYDKRVRLWTLTEPATSVALGRHRAAVTAVAFRDGGREIVSASMDGEVRAWAPRATPQRRGHLGIVNMVAFSPDGRRLASVGDDHTVRLWDRATARQLQLLRGHGARVMSVAFSPDGRTLVSGAHDGSVLAWNLQTLPERRTLQRHEAAVTALAFTRDGRRLVTASWDRSTRVLDLASGKVLASFAAPSDTWAAALSSDDRLLATAGVGGVIRIYRLSADAADARPRPFRQLRGHGATIWGLRFAPDGALYSSSEDRSLRRWDVQSGRSELVARVPSRPYRLAVGPRGKRLAASGADGKLRVFSLARSTPPPKGDARPILVIPAHRSEAGTVRFSPDGRQLASGGDDGTVRLFDLPTGQPSWRATGARATPNVGAALVANGRRAQLLDRAGERCGTIAVGPRARAVARLDGILAVGFAEGSVELRPLSPAQARACGARLAEEAGSSKPKPKPKLLEGTPSAAVTTLAAGPAQTLLVGFASGEWIVASRRGGPPLYRGKLHGAVVRLAHRAGRVSIGSDVGDEQQVDLGALRLPYCELLRRVWRAAPLAWEGGKPVERPPPAAHRCHTSR